MVTAAGADSEAASATIKPEGAVGGKTDAERRRHLEALRDVVAARIKSGISPNEMQKDFEFPDPAHRFMYEVWRAEKIAGMYRMVCGAEGPAS
jgi:hypothetical protein